eukprot:38780-Rhodomonas_salina.2
MLRTVVIAACVAGSYAFTASPALIRAGAATRATSGISGVFIFRSARGFFRVLCCRGGGVVGSCGAFSGHERGLHLRSCSNIHCEQRGRRCCRETLERDLECMGFTAGARLLCITFTVMDVEASGWEKRHRLDPWGAREKSSDACVRAEAVNGVWHWQSMKMQAKSKAVPFLSQPEALDGSMAGDVGFDPFGISSVIDIKWLRESELKHGRICMLAATGCLVQVRTHLPFAASTRASSRFLLSSSD